MTRQQLEHLIRAASVIAEDDLDAQRAELVAQQIAADFARREA